MLCTFSNVQRLIRRIDATHEIEGTSSHPKETGELLYTRAVQLSRLSWSSGLFVGPILSGILTEKYGYYKMNFTLGLLKAPLHRLKGEHALMIGSWDLHCLRFVCNLEPEIVRAPKAYKSFT